MDRHDRWRRLRLEPLEVRALLAAAPILSELMAAGGGDLFDGHGATPDWIELYNAGDTALDLTGWHLTDAADNLTKWTFPSGALDAGAFLVVFASGNDEIDAAGHLHTNFGLSSGGEYLALVEPDGATIASQLGGGFPKQFNETSFGLPLSFDTTPLIAGGDAATVLVPTIANGGDALGDAWKGGAEPFDDNLWAFGPTGIGFGAAPSGDPPINLAPLGTATASSELGGTFLALRANDGNRAGNDNGLIFHTNTDEGEYWWEVDLGGDYYLDRLQIFPRTNAAQSSVENFRIDVFDSGGGSVFTKNYLTADSTRDLPWGTAEVRNVLGRRVRISRLDGDPDFLTFAEFEVWGRSAPIAENLALGGNASATNVHGLSAIVDAIDGDIDGTFWHVDTTGVGSTNPIYHSATNVVGNFWQVDLGAVEAIDYINVFGRTDFQANASDVTLQVLAADGVTVNFTQDLQLVGADLGGQRYDLTVDLTDVDGRFVKIISNQGGSNFALALAEVEVFADSGGVANPDIETDVAAAMEGISSSAFLRMPFQVADPSGSDQLLLRMKYNDGFVAYINGVEVARRNAPETTTWQSAATAPHSAFTFEAIAIPNATALLNPGLASDNILAIHGLNTSNDNPDFLILPELSELTVESSGPPRYFPVPTPGFASGAAAENLGPAVYSLTEMTTSANDADDLVITAAVADTYSPTDEVTLYYRVQFAAETPVVMTDDGAGADAVAGDGLYTAVIPASASSPGDPVRWRVEATNIDGNTSMWPMFADQLGDTQSEQYFGAMVADASAVSALPILFWWVQDTGAADTRTGTRGVVSYDGELYDNVFIRKRGANTTSGNKFKFGDDHPFFYADSAGRVSEFNLNANGSDPAYVRQTLAFETYRNAGVAASESFLLLSQRNGAFHRVGTWIEQPDEPEFLDRNNLDKDGTVYKLVSGTTNPTFAAVNGAVVKKYPDDGTDKSDIQVVFDGLNLTSEEDRRAFLFDVFDVPALVNFIAARAFTQDIDSTRKNFYMYRDTDGTGEWSLFPWDNDWTFGVVGGGSPIVADDADEAASGNPNFVFSSHPFIGDATHELYESQYSLLHEVVHNVPETRDMFLRRLRTLMDTFLQPPNTPYEQRLFENRVDALFAPAAPHLSGGIATAVAQLKDYFERRRVHLYLNHSIHNTGGGGIVSTIVPEFTGTARYFVPTDNSVTDWTGVADPANIAEWSTGATGIGYDDPSGNQAYVSLLNTTVEPTLGNDQVDPADDCAECTSVFVRIPFTIPNQATLDAIQSNGMTLAMKYDDGFVAHLNGVQVASRGVSGPQFYDSTAANRNETAAVNYEFINVSAHTGALAVGGNVLAIHGINQAATSSDLLILPELHEGTVALSTDVAGIPDEQLAHPAIQFGQIEGNPAGGNQDEEFIELTNPNATAVDLSGWELDGGVDFTFQPGTVIPAGGSLYVSPDVVAFRARASGPNGGQGLFVQGGYRGHISNLGEQVDLLAGDGTVVASIVTPLAPSDAQRYLRISEIMYHPADPTVDEQLAGFTDDNDFEFVELVNTSDTATLDLTGVAFTQGIQYAFTAGTMLAPSERILVVRDAAAFAARYDTAGLNIAGEYRDPFDGSNKLSNNGETLKIEDADNSTIQQFAYNDSANQGWPTSPDGEGHSLEAVSFDNGDGDPTAWNDYGESAMWYASLENGGSPGAAATTAVIERFVFYDGSAFDTGNDDDAIAPDKVALRPEQTATAANYTNFEHGINGVIVDIAWPANASLLTDGDFTVLIGNDNDPSSWTAAAAPVVTIHQAAGRGGSDRVSLSWPTGGPTNTWLQVTARSDVPNTGLTADDVFYFGNAIGETGNDPANALTTAADLIAIRNNTRGDGNRADLANPHDVDRDRHVDATDALLARNHATGPFDALRLITPAVPVAPLPEGEDEGGCEHRPNDSDDGASERVLPPFSDDAIVSWLRDSLS